MIRTTAMRRAGAAVLLVAVLSGCSGPAGVSPPPTGTQPPSAEPTATPDVAAATDGRVIVAVTQGRSDYAAEVFAIAVENTTDEEITVRSARLRSTAFTADVDWDGDAIVPAGATRDLRVPVPVFSCPVSDRTLTLSVDYAAAGGEHTADLVPIDPFGVVERLSGEACLAASVDDVVDIGLSDELVVTGSGGSASASLSLLLSPVVAGSDGPGGSVTVVSVDATTLLSPDDGSPRWDIDDTVTAGDAASTVALAAIPARCDAHAIAEDKVGTVLRVRVRSSSGAEGLVSVPASAELRSAIYTFVSDACADRGR